ncbi:hypothetical protein SIIN_1812_T [Serendipita indica DSM 11827]|nr:hypothetical protein SIIN_1812_T [Serendipita indica DSM 11827]
MWSKKSKKPKKEHVNAKPPQPSSPQRASSNKTQVYDTANITLDTQLVEPPNQPLGEPPLPGLKWDMWIMAFSPDGSRLVSSRRFLRQRSSKSGAFTLLDA